MAARKVGVDRRSVYAVRERNAAFATSWDRALGWAREQLAAVGGGGASAGPSPEGEGRSAAYRRRGTLRLRDDEIVRASKRGHPCVIRAGEGRWSTGGERAFLETLVATANVTAAARAAGVSTVTAYNRRRQWPAFAAQWDAALAEGWQRLELMLVCAATATLDPDPAIVEGCEPPAMSVEQAMALWQAHRARVNGGKPQRYGWRRQEPDIETVRAEIRRKIDAIRAGRALPAPRD